jgi:hypothetical protein
VDAGSIQGKASRLGEMKEKVCTGEAPLPTGEAPALPGLRVCGVAATELSPNNMTSYLQSCERRTRHLRGAFVSHSSFCEEVLSRVLAESPIRLKQRE